VCGKIFRNTQINAARLLAAAEAGSICNQSTVHMLNIQKCTLLYRWGGHKRSRSRQPIFPIRNLRTAVLPTRPRSLSVTPKLDEG